MRIATTVNQGQAQDAGAFCNDQIANKAMAGGCIGVSVACVGGVILNVASGAPLGALYYAGLATMASAGAVAAMAE